MRCKICHSPSTSPLPFDIPESAGRWVRCKDCGSDSSSNFYRDVKDIYDANYSHTHGLASGDPDRQDSEVLSNCDWFDHHAKDLPNRDFLDIGCCDGAALRVMQRLGWAVHGFDVTEPPYMGPHVTVRPYFHRWWFGTTRFSAILAREVIEHVDSPSLFLHECHGTLCPGGLLQVQTPKPAHRFHGAIYQKAHLVIISEKAMRSLLNDAMFNVLDFRDWGGVDPQTGEDRQDGMAFMCKART